MGSAICGGVISVSQLHKDMKKYGVWADMMSFVLPDKQYAKYIALLKKGDLKSQKKADAIFDKYAISQI